MPPFIVLDFAGHDPSGGAGIQADIETIAQLGGHCLPIITANTIQNTQSFIETQTIEAAWLKRQTEHLLQDMSPNAIKIGLITSTSTVDVLAELLQDLPGLPLVLDPVLRSGSGTDLTNPELIQEIRNKLLPHATLVTPNQHEARTLSDCDSLDEAANTLIHAGCRFVLITGADEAEAQVQNRLYGANGLIQVYNSEKLPGTYHGSGCTLSAAITAMLASGLNLRTAVEQALTFTFETLKAGQQIGQGQNHPGRISSKPAS